MHGYRRKNGTTPIQPMSAYRTMRSRRCDCDERHMVDVMTPTMASTHTAASSTRPIGVCRRLTSRNGV
jgi:hypothetical protein